MKKIIFTLLIFLLNLNLILTQEQESENQYENCLKIETFRSKSKGGTLATSIQDAKNVCGGSNSIQKEDCPANLTLQHIRNIRLTCFYVGYYYNKNLAGIGYVINGNRHGLWQIYQSKKNGVLNSVGLFENGKRTGEWKTYNLNGELKKIEIYNQDGKVDKTILTEYIESSIIKNCPDILTEAEIIKNKLTCIYTKKNFGISIIKEYKNGEINK